MTIASINIPSLSDQESRQSDKIKVDINTKRFIVVIDIVWNDVPIAQCST